MADSSGDDYAAIFASLCLKEAIERGKADPSMKRFVEDRKDPVKYLSQDFPDAKALLSVMADTGTVISGSRALEYFVPGSTSKDSDWDFYVPGTEQGVRSMMRELGKNGVEWDKGFLQRVLDFSQDPSADPVEITGREVHRLLSFGKEQFQKILKRIEDTEAKDLLQRCMDHISSHRSGDARPIFCQGFIIERDHQGIIQVEEKQSSYPAHQDYDDLEVIRGHLKRGEREVPVQLILCKSFGEPMSPFTSISNFYATHVQCFIAGYFAGHFFYDTAAKKESLLWPAEDRESHRMRACLRKYKKRGYRFIRDELVSKPKTPRYTSFKEEGSYAIIFNRLDKELDPALPNTGPTPTTFTERAEKCLENLAWGAFNGRMHLLLNKLSMQPGPEVDKSIRVPFPVGSPFLLHYPGAVSRTVAKVGDRRDEEIRRLLVSGGFVFSFQENRFWMYPGNGVYQNG